MDTLEKQEETRPLNVEENSKLLNLRKAIKEIYKTEEIIWKQRARCNG